MMKAYGKALCDIITGMFSEPNQLIAMALSGGYDSNCLLRFVKHIFPEAHVNAICVGEQNGADERKTAGTIAGFYENVQFSEAVVSPDTLEKLDEIVSRLEGCVYERGIFLQYELAAKLAQSGIARLLCGECADQVFHPRSYTETGDPFVYGFQSTPREMAAYVVLPKSFMMLKSFGIQRLYPYLDQRIVTIGRDTGAINGTDKKFQKDFCRKHLPGEIFSKIGKKGGTTSLKALFDPGFDIEKGIRESKYYDPDFRTTKRFPPGETFMDYYLSLKYIESFERQFCD